MNRFRLNPRPLLLATAVLLLSYTLALTSLSALSPTFDEQGFIVRGLGYLRGQNQHMRVGHPLGLNALNAALLVNDATVQLPTDHPSWQENSFHRPAELFLWEIGNDVEQVMFLARLPTIWLAMLLLAVVGRWTQQLTHRSWPALLAMSLLAFDPNILAHAVLATTDFGLTLAAFLATYTLWRYWSRPSPTTAVVAAIALAFLLNTKFTAGLFILPLGLLCLLGLAQQPSHGRWSTFIRFLLIYPAVGFFALWASYGFQIGPLPDPFPIATLAGQPFPLSHYFQQLVDIGGRLQVETPAFLMGQYSPTGWWYYFPLAFLLKTPLPILFLLILATALALFLRQRNPAYTYFDIAALLLPPLFYFAIALTSQINLGYRHLLPILPFTAVFIATTLAHTAQTPRPSARWLAPVAATAVLLLLARTLLIHPHHLSYFNLLAGGPNGGWRYLVDSNIDWGQDLANLKSWMDEEGVDQLWLSYFGEGRPDYYQIAYRGLDSWPPRLMDPTARPYSPHHPAPGLYAISATNLQGVHFANPDQFAWFRQQTPIAKIGYSIFIYHVPAVGPPVDLLLAGLQLDQLTAEHLALLGSNDLVLRWFDPSQAFQRPSSSTAWLALAKNTAVNPTLAANLPNWTAVAQTDAYTLYQLPATTAVTQPPLATFSLDNGRIQLQNSELAPTSPDQPISIHTQWQQAGPPTAVNIFLHILDQQDQIVAQWDGLGAAWQGWQPTDLLQITHQIPLPVDLPPGRYKIQSGLYDPQTGQRWLNQDGHDRFFLHELLIQPAPE